MKTKLTILACACAAIMMFYGTAMADPYPLQFDPDGNGGAVYSPDTIWGWDLEAYAKETIPVPNGTTIFGNGTGDEVDIVTHQSLGADGLLGNGDIFTEAITVKVLNGLSAPPTYGSNTNSYEGWPPAIPSANLFIDLNLTGHVTNFTSPVPVTANNPFSIALSSYTALYDLGVATMYVDMDNNQTFTAGDISLLQFNLSDAGPFILVPSVFNGAAATISFNFQTVPDSINLDYFDNAPGYPAFLDSVAQGFHFTMTQGDIAVINQFGGITSTPALTNNNNNYDQILLAFQETGFDAKFQTVPEPSTILLLGCGLVGVAAFGKKRFSK